MTSLPAVGNGSWQRLFSVAMVALLLGFGPLAAVEGSELREAMRSRVEAIQAGFPVRAGGKELKVPEALAAFYASRGFELAWARSGALTEQIDALLGAMETAQAHGLNAELYHGRLVRDLRSAGGETLPVPARIDLELLLSDAFLLLGANLSEGQIPPNGTRLEDVADSLRPLLDQALSSNSIGAILSALAPQQDGYQKLLGHRRRLVGLLGTPWPPIASGMVLAPGTDSKRMPDITRRLSLLGDLAADYPADNWYDGTEAQAVKRFQKRHGLAADGLVGPSTLEALNRPPRERLQQLDANLERWRWLPEQLGERHLRVNLASGVLEAVEKNQTAWQAKTDVSVFCRSQDGKTRLLHYVVFNPEWLVSPKQAVDQLWPLVKDNPERLASVGFKLRSGWGPRVRELDLAKANWSRLDDPSVPFRLVQQPGPYNVLGEMAFRLESEPSLMLHGGPAEGSFLTNGASFVGGCIRLKQPGRLLEWVMAAQPAEQAPDKNAAPKANGSTRTLTLATPIPVHVGYRTVWVDSEDRLHYRFDWRQRDLPLAKALAEGETAP